MDTHSADGPPGTRLSREGRSPMAADGESHHVTFSEPRCQEPGLGWGRGWSGWEEVAGGAL